MTADDMQVLTFTLGDEDYCLDIEYVAEIVDGGEMTSIPNSEAYVEGVMDLRGRTTTIVNPCRILDTEDVRAEDVLTDGGQSQNRIIVLDSDTVDADSATGWLVSDVEAVADVSEKEVEAGNVADADLLEGLIKEDDGFTLWLNPEKFTV
ncbi:MULTISPECIES: chemotaxis protein CheW [Salinibaculum]|uniref:chemotaxis protein CheW n=1 Tax=Salinibaculum TaxID=2732368 RepID=UPI0030D39BDB